MAHVLWNAGYGDPKELQGVTAAWAISSIPGPAGPDRLRPRPHGPVGGAGPTSVKRVALGNGFFCPADCSPLPDLRPWLPPQPENLQEDERHVLECMNGVLGAAASCRWIGLRNSTARSMRAADDSGGSSTIIRSGDVEAAKEVSSVIMSALREAESDGTYSRYKGPARVYG